MKKRLPQVVDLLIYIGWTFIGLLNFIFFIVHANPANVSGIFEGSASLSFTFMSVSAFIMLILSAYVIYLARRRKALLAGLRASLL